MNNVGWIYMSDMLKGTLVVNDIDEVWQGY